MFVLDYAESIKTACESSWYMEIPARSYAIQGDDGGWNTFFRNFSRRKGGIGKWLLIEVCIDLNIF